MNTVLFTAAAVVFQTGLGFLLAVLLASVRRCGAIYRTIIFAPFVLSAVTAGAVWQYLFSLSWPDLTDLYPARTD